MSTNILLSLDTRRSKKDGTYPLVLRISHNRRTATVQLGYSLHKRDWDEKKRKVKKSYTGTQSLTRLNHRLMKIQAEAMEKVRLLEEQDLLPQMTATDIKRHLTSVTSHTSFLAYTQKLIDELFLVKKFGTAQSYYTVLGVLNGFIAAQGKKDLDFTDVNYAFLKRLEQSHLAKGNSLNGLAVYMRTIRAIYNKGIKDGLVDKKHYPFEQYKIRTEPTKKRALSVEGLQKILNLKLEEENALFHYRNYFLASYFLWGISFMDLAFLRAEDITEDRISYRRKKTGKFYAIRINDHLRQIIEYYLQMEHEQGFIFPMIKRTDPELQYKDVKWERKRYNKGLGEIAKLCEIEEKITSYVVRHSFATQALLNEVPLKAISEMLGHSNLSTTQVYLKSLPTHVLDDYADRLGLE